MHGFNQTRGYMLTLTPSHFKCIGTQSFQLIFRLLASYLVALTVNQTAQSILKPSIQLHSFMIKTSSVLMGSAISLTHLPKKKKIEFTIRQIFELIALSWSLAFWLTYKNNKFSYLPLAEWVLINRFRNQAFALSGFCGALAGVITE